MAKKLVGTLKLQIPAGQANPSPPLVLRWVSVVLISWSSAKLLMLKRVIWSLVPLARRLLNIFRTNLLRWISRRRLRLITSKRLPS